MNDQKNNDKKAAFGRFWQKQGTNSIIGLVITLVVILYLSIAHYIRFSWPVWVVIVLVFWALQTWWRFHLFQKDEAKEAEKKEKKK